MQAEVKRTSSKKNKRRKIDTTNNIHQTNVVRLTLSTFELGRVFSVAAVLLRQKVNKRVPHFFRLVVVAVVWLTAVSFLNCLNTYNCASWRIVYFRSKFSAIILFFFFITLDEL